MCDLDSVSAHDVDEKFKQILRKRTGKNIYIKLMYPLIKFIALCVFSCKKKNECHIYELIDWLVFNSVFSHISSISWHEKIIQFTL
jgi:pheromone shutdown protein TraB